MKQSPMLYTVEQYTDWMIAEGFWPEDSEPKDPGKYVFPMIAVAHAREGRAPLVERVYVGPIWQWWMDSWASFVAAGLAKPGTLVDGEGGVDLIGTKTAGGHYARNPTDLIERYAVIWEG